MSDQSIAFVRHETLPPSPPPASETGIVKWMRENLFSSVTNSILTLAALYAIYSILSGSMPWILGGIWQAPSLQACREILAGDSAGCFAVLTERWHQLIFGFKYPQDAYWRPTLAFVLLIVSVAPVLFSNLPRQMLILTAIYPFVGFWLIWGGSIFVPLGAAVALYSGVKVFSALSKADTMSAIFLALLAVIAVYLVWFWVFFTQDRPDYLWIATWVSYLFYGAVSYYAVKLWKNNTTLGFAEIMVILGIFSVTWIYLQPFLSVKLVPLFTGLEGVIWIFNGLGSPISTFASIEAVASRDMGGFMLNIILGTVCVSLSLPIGILLALGRQSNMPIIKIICVFFIEFIRGVPLITLLFVANVVLAYFLPPGTTFDLILRVIIMITMFSSAYIAEVIRGGLAALPRGQYEAGDSLGLDYAQSMRLIILPQALKISIPGIVNVAVGLFKDTTLVSVISMFDLVGMIRGPILASTEWNGVYWELFGFASLLFFIICYGISQYSQWLERQLATDHR